MASRSIADLSPTMQAFAMDFTQRCADDAWLKDHGIRVMVICTHRSVDEQNALYAQGRTAPGRIVTNARGGQSAHNVTSPGGKPSSEAFDVLPLRHGKPVWGTSGNGIDDDPSDDDRDDLEVWQRVGALVLASGLKWYGSPGSAFKEFPHCQNTEWRLR